MTALEILVLYGLWVFIFLLVLIYCTGKHVKASPEAHYSRIKIVKLSIKYLFSIICITLGMIALVIIGSIAYPSILFRLPLITVKYYIPLLLFFLMIVPLKAFTYSGLLSDKQARYSWIALFSILVILPVGSMVVWSYYDNTFARIRFNDRGGSDGFSYIGTPPLPSELRSFSPFQHNSKLALLDEPSTLYLTQNLPRLDGARALYPVYAAFGQALYPGGVYKTDSVIGYHNTIPAYRRLQDREADIIFVASPSKEQELRAKELGVSMKFTPIGREAFIFFINVNNPVETLTVDQIRDIYSGKVTWWNQLGGKYRKIYPFQRNAGSGSQTALLKFMGSVPLKEASKELVAGNMGGVIQRVADYTNYDGAIGFSFRYFAQELIRNEEVKLLAVNGVHPSFETIKAGTYPLSAEFYAVTLEDNPNPNVALLLDWILSAQGQELIEKTGYVSIR